MKKPYLVALVISFVLLTSPASALAASTRTGQQEPSNERLRPECGPTGLTIGANPENISRSISLHVVFVGYDQNVIDTGTMDANINQYYELQYWDAYLQYTFNIDYAFADQSYLEDLKSFILTHSVTGTGITSALNVTALQHQRETGTPMSVFLPQSGMAIDARAVEQWFADNPHCDACSDESGYTFYMLNFTEFDSTDHSFEHWYNTIRYDVEAKSINDYWRLEWDNPLNPNVKFPYPAYTSKHRLLFIDPSAFQWYLTWARIWWKLDSFLIGPKYEYYYHDLDGFLASYDVSTPYGRDALAQYLAGWVDDFLYNMISPVVWPMTGDTLSLQVLVLNDVSEYGYTNENMKWMLNTTLVEESVKELAPYMKVEVTTKYENLSSYPELEEMLNSCFIEEKNGWRYYDGYQLFYDLLTTRDQHFNMRAADMTVDAYVFLLKNASLETGPSGMEFTGLGGMQQVLLLKSIDRYFRPDGVAPKSGLGMYMIHELGHNIAFGHTFGPLRYAGDFAEDVMGYYSYFYSFCKLRTDLFRRTVADMKLLDLNRALRSDANMHWPWPKQTQFFRDYLLNAIESNIKLANEKYADMDYLSSYYSVLEAESLETYTREIAAGMRVPGDIDSDGKCHIADFFAFVKAYGSTPSSPNWNPSADLNKDGIVDSADYQILKWFFGRKAKTTVGFFRWTTNAKTPTIDVGATIFPEYDMPYVEANITYGLQNWDRTSLSCLIRISDITLPNLIKSVNIKVYDQTTTVGEITWASDTAPSTNWVKLTLDPSTRYSISIEIQGTAEAYYDMTIITLECKQLPPRMPPCFGRSQTHNLFPTSRPVVDAA